MVTNVPICPDELPPGEIDPMSAPHTCLDACSLVLKAWGHQPNSRLPPCSKQSPTPGAAPILPDDPARTTTNVSFAIAAMMQTMCSSFTIEILSSAALRSSMHFHIRYAPPSRQAESLAAGHMLSKNAHNSANPRLHHRRPCALLSLHVMPSPTAHMISSRKLARSRPRMIASIVRRKMASPQVAIVHNSPS